MSDRPGEASRHSTAVPFACGACLSQRHARLTRRVSHTSLQYQRRRHARLGSTQPEAQRPLVPLSSEQRSSLSVARLTHAHIVNALSPRAASSAAERPRRPLTPTLLDPGPRPPHEQSHVRHNTDVPPEAPTALPHASPAPPSPRPALAQHPRTPHPRRRRRGCRIADADAYALAALELARRATVPRRSRAAPLEALGAQRALARDASRSPAPSPLRYQRR